MMETMHAEVNHWLSVEPVVRILEECREGITADQVKEAISLLEDTLIDAEEYINKVKAAKDGLAELVRDLAIEPSKNEAIIAKLDDSLEYLRDIDY